MLFYQTQISLEMPVSAWFPLKWCRERMKVGGECFSWQITDITVLKESLPSRRRANIILSLIFLDQLWNCLGWKLIGMIISYINILSYPTQWYIYFLTHGTLFYSLYLCNLLQVVKTYNYSSSSKEHSHSFHFSPDFKCNHFGFPRLLGYISCLSDELIRAVQCQHRYLEGKTFDFVNACTVSHFCFSD